MTTDALVRSVELQPAKKEEERVGHPWHVPAIRALAEGLALHPMVTYLIGENGSGKSTTVRKRLARAAAIALDNNLWFQSNVPSQKEGCMWRTFTYRQAKRLAVSFVCATVAAAGVSACGANQGRVVIQTGKHAGKTYAPGLVGGATAEECIRRGICFEQEE